MCLEILKTITAICVAFYELSDMATPIKDMAGQAIPFNELPLISSMVFLSPPARHAISLFIFMLACAYIGTQTSLGTKIRKWLKN